MVNSLFAPTSHPRRSDFGFRPNFQVLGEDWDTGLKVVRDFGDGNDLYERLIKVRGYGHDGPVRFFFDSYSYHYGLIEGDVAVGTLTVTRLVDGALDCQSFYPSCLLDTFYGEVFTTCKFRIAGTAKSSFRTLRMMLRHAWSDQLEQGSRLVLINSDQKLVPFYKRIGFEVIENSEFIHPLLGTSSVCMLMRADPNAKSFFSDLFEQVGPPISTALTPLPFPNRHFQGA